jgi:hypothetical protein
MGDTLDEYFKALDRLKKGKPLRVALGTKITNDAVSLEAGRKKGTIKKSRPVFADLIAAIQAVVDVEPSPQEIQKEQLSRAKAEAEKYRILWEEALIREVSLVKQLWTERNEWASEKAALTGEKVVPIFKPVRAR